MQRHSLVLVASPLVAQLIALIRKHRQIYLAHLYASFIISTLINAHAQTVCTRPSPPPILEGLGTGLSGRVPWLL